MGDQAVLVQMTHPPPCHHSPITGPVSMQKKVGRSENARNNPLKSQADQETQLQLHLGLDERLQQAVSKTSRPAETDHTIELSFYFQRVTHKQHNTILNKVNSIEMMYICGLYEDKC